MANAILVLSPLAAPAHAAPAHAVAPIPNAASTLKPRAYGLGDRGPAGSWATLVNPLPASYQPALGQVAVSLRWKDLQPNGPNDAIPQASVDAALKQVADANPAHPAQVRLRVFAGAQAPQWLEDSVGSVLLTDPNFGKSAAVPRWWNPRMATYYKNLQVKLAALYDDPAAAGASPYAGMVSEVVVSMTTDFYPEPLLRHIGGGAGAANIEALRVAGYTKDDDIISVEASIDAHKVWKRTYTNFSFNPYQWVTFTADRSAVLAMDAMDVVQTEAFVDYFRAALGRRAVLGNDSLRPAFIAEGPYSVMYAYLLHQATPGIISFQTQSAASGFTYAELKSVVSWAIAQNTSGTTSNAVASIELPDEATYTKPPYPLAELVAMNNLLTASAQ